VSLLERTAQIQSAFTAKQLKVLGVVWASPRAIDLAIRGLNSLQTVVRFTESALASDCCELATMLTEGDFTRAFIVYTAEDQPHLSGEIESYPLSRIDELAALLAKESTP
jgi:hypothetical protein